MTTSSDPDISSATAAPPDICAALRAAQEVVLMSHVTPDADALASAGALWLALREMGKRAHLVMPAGTVSRRLEYLVRLADLRPAHADDVRAADLIVALDTAKEKRLSDHGHLAVLTRVPVMNIDHHATNTNFGRWNWIVPQASSTSELVYLILRSLGCAVSPVLATLLYAGLHTDTQGFSLSNTTPRSLQVGHDLAAAGARVAEVCERMHRSRSRGEFELMRIVYDNTRVSEDGRVAWSHVTHDDIVRTGCTAADIDDQVEIPRSIEGITLAILFSEGEPGKIRMNFRGEGGTSVLALASEFGGGGHHAAAGARLSGSLDEIMPRVLAAAATYAANLGVATVAPACTH
ncbi:MAG: DHH family phosphoesterase [Phycisphaerales bacterium]|nr:DHH family phosphoesterase [Phycisphaerales bacterium]